MSTLNDIFADSDSEEEDEEDLASKRKYETAKPLLLPSSSSSSSSHANLNISNGEALALVESGVDIASLISSKKSSGKSSNKSSSKSSNTTSVLIFEDEESEDEESDEEDENENNDIGSSLFLGPTHNLSIIPEASFEDLSKTNNTTLGSVEHSEHTLDLRPNAINNDNKNISKDDKDADKGNSRSSLTAYGLSPIHMRPSLSFLPHEEDEEEEEEEEERGSKSTKAVSPFLIFED